MSDDNEKPRRGVRSDMRSYAPTGLICFTRRPRARARGYCLSPRPGLSTNSSTRPQIQKLNHVLVENFLRLRIREGEAHFVDHLGAHADPFAPAGGAGFVLDFVTKSVAERALGEAGADSAAAAAEGFAF